MELQGEIPAAEPAEISVSRVFSQFSQDPDSSLEAQRENYQETYDRTLTQLELDDRKWIIAERPRILYYFKWLLAVQNSLVFVIVMYALSSGLLKDLEIVFSVLIAATLTETAFAVRLMVSFLFKPISYVNRFTNGKSRRGKK